MYLCSWPNTSCQVTARYYKPGINDEGFVEGTMEMEMETPATSTETAEGINKFETQSLSSLRMKLSDENTSCTLQTSSITMTNTSSDDFKFKIDYSMTPATANQPSPFTLNLEFESECAPFQVNDGKVHFGENKGDGFIEMKFVPSGRCQGKIQIEGKVFDFNGGGICLRQFQGVRPHLTTKRWNCAYFRENGSGPGPVKSLFSIQMLSSSAYNGETIHYGFYHDGKKLQAVTSLEDKILFSKTIVDPDTGYCVPEHFEYHWNGVDMDGKDFKAKVSGSPAIRMARIDLLSNLPVVLRKIVESLSSARPYIYQKYNQQIEATVNGEKVVGCLFQEYSFLLEDPSQYQKP